MDMDMEPLVERTKDMPVDTEPLIELTDVGTVQGEVVDGVARFLAVPYAAPPVGALRWRPPAPVVPWIGVRRIPDECPACPQPRWPGHRPEPFEGKTVVDSEDCLVLNVFTPSDALAGGRLPCIVYIHGGAGKYGTAMDPFISGAALASQARVCYISLNYRLGVFGFLAHHALVEEDDARDEGTPRGAGNYAILDMVAALRWVQAHAPSFGGDPSCVTIWGLSSGAQFVSTLLVCPLAAGLFHRALVQSCVDVTNVRKLRGGSDVWLGRSAVEWGGEFAATVGAAKTAESAAIPPERCAENGLYPAAETPGSCPNAADVRQRLVELSRTHGSTAASPHHSLWPCDCPRVRQCALQARAEIAAMRALPQETLVHHSHARAATCCYESAVDRAEGSAKPVSSVEALAAGRISGAVPVMIGVTDADGLGASESEHAGMFDESAVHSAPELAALWGREFGAAAAEAYEVHYPPSFRKLCCLPPRVGPAIAAFAKDCWYDGATAWMADRLAAAEVSTYVYRFVEKVHHGGGMTRAPPSSWHGADTFFWNGGTPPRSSASASETQLGRTMISFLSNFAR